VWWERHLTDPSSLTTPLQLSYRHPPTTSLLLPNLLCFLCLRRSLLGLSWRLGWGVGEEEQSAAEAVAVSSGRHDHGC